MVAMLLTALTALTTPDPPGRLVYDLDRLDPTQARRLEGRLVACWVRVTGEAEPVTDDDYVQPCATHDEIDRTVWTTRGKWIIPVGAALVLGTVVAVELPAGEVNGQF